MALCRFNVTLKRGFVNPAYYFGSIERFFINELWFNAMGKLACLAGIILDSRGGRGIRSLWKETPEMPVRSNSEGHGLALRNADSGPDDEFE